MDAANTALISVGLDAKLIIWDFKTRVVKMELDLPGYGFHLDLHCGTNLIAVACDDLVLYMCA